MRRVGKLLFYLFFLIFITQIRIGICAPPNYDMRLTLRRVKNGLDVILQNSPSEPVSIPAPIVEWRPGTGGMEFRIWTVEGKESYECVMIDYPGNFQRKVELKPLEKITSNFRINEIQKNFCLKSGKYFLQTLFHNEVNGEELSRNILSNPILIDFPGK